jgi:hypothetical protein
MCVLPATRCVLHAVRVVLPPHRRPIIVVPLGLHAPFLTALLAAFTTIFWGLN